MWLSIGAAFLPIIFAIIFFKMPESPYYFLGIGKKNEAEKSLEWLRGAFDDEAQCELLDIQVFIYTNLIRGKKF